MRNNSKLTNFLSHKLYFCYIRYAALSLFLFCMCVCMCRPIIVKNKNKNKNTRPRFMHGKVVMETY